MPTYTVADGQTRNFSLSSSILNETDTINASGSSKISIVVDQGTQASPYPVDAVLNLALGAQVDAVFGGIGINRITVNGDASTTLIDNGTNNLNVTGRLSGAPQLVIKPKVVGTGTFNLSNSSSLEFGGSVASGITVNFGPSNFFSATLKLDTPNAFMGLVNFYGGDLFLAGLNQATDYDLSNGVLTIYGGPNDQALDSIRFVDNSPEKAGLALRLNGGTVQVSEQGSNGTRSDSFLAGTLLVQHVAPQPPTTQPSAPQAVAVHDTTTGTDLPDTSSAYSGPVAGITSQFISTTPDNLNVTAKADNLFIKTGAGNDAIALHGGTNVVDAGAGSNFLTAGTGFDTFFLDARNIPAASSAAGPVPGAVWDTIQEFGHGDAATLWGVGPGTALAWQQNEGAVGHTGLTLHANLANGSEASLTLAGVDSKAALSLSYGQSGGSNYLYVKAV